MPSAQDLISELLDESIRARQRRVHITSNTEATLYALKAVDAKFDDNLRALASFGFGTLEQCEQRLRAANATEKDAAVHVLCALAVQLPASTQRDEAILNIVKRYWGGHTQSVSDALWFFPVGLSEFDIRHDHVILLLKQADPAVQHIGVTLAACRGAMEAGPWVYDKWRQLKGEDTALYRACELTLACLGLNPPPEQRLADLLTGPIGARKHALELIAQSGHARKLLGVSRYLDLAAIEDSAAHPLSWYLAALADPQACAIALCGAPQVADELRVRVGALIGAPRDLIDCVQAITAQDTPPGAAHRDALLVLLGQVPVAAIQTPIDPQMRSAQLRTHVLQCLRHSHVNVNNEADVCPWEPEQFLAPESLATTTRLRFGQRLHAPQPGCIPVEIASRLSAPMRQALYWEQACAHGHSFGFGLLAYANARMQYSVLHAAQWHDEHLAQRAV